MKQTSKTIKKSPATTPLYQPPTPANTVQHKSSGLVPVSVLIIGAAIASGLYSCTADQHATTAQTEYLIKAGVKP
ncbi:hypothetical protein [Acinetobacter zhairhuonensis]|uniref:hypothetical protein n=1 Tax=Acinetobacter sp. A7.4 TaxID=2919921 RepID=UPI001F4FBDB2|nr:hypothetical protein [Acinetobacter sp. A7.4]MCJ8162302.1 hypothetical protein [Acinetobacter sp. A7.4]